MSKNMEVIDIVKDYLEQNGYDGLFNSDNECACEVDDLAPCGEMSDYCRAGFKQACNCGDHDWHIGYEQEATKKENELR